MILRCTKDELKRRWQRRCIALMNRRDATKEGTKERKLLTSRIMELQLCIVDIEIWRPSK